MPATAVDDPFSPQSENQTAQQLENHPVQALGIMVVGIMGIQGRLIAVLKTSQGHFHVVSNGDMLGNEGIEIVELGWQRILARHNGRIHQLNIPRVFF